MVMKSRFFMRALRSMLAPMAMLAWNGFCETAPAGFVGLEKNDAGVWWFKSPEGNPFLSIGMNHVEPEYWQSPNNRAFVLETYGPDLFASDGTFHDGSSAADNWAHRAAAFLSGRGFNTLGVHNPPSKSLRSTGALYYVVELKYPCNWGWNSSRSALVRAFRKNPLDVFDESFAAEVRAQAEKLVKPCAHDPLVLGYAYTDGPPWTVDDEPKSTAFQKLSAAEKTIHPWVLALMSLPPQAKGKQAWLAMMQERYPSPGQAAATYACEAKGWDGLAAKTGWAELADTAQAADDSQAFLERIMRQWYAVRKEAIRQYDPNHLILGDKLNMNRDSNHPEQLVGSLHAMRDYVDAINIQYYGLYDKQRDALALLYKESGKPVLYGDTTFTPYWKDPSPNDPGYTQRLGQTFSEELPKLFSLPWVVGWHHCGYMRGLRKPYIEAMKRGDQKAVDEFEKGGHTYREGFITEFEEPIEPIIDPLGQAISTCGKLHRASGAPKKTNQGTIL